MKVALVHDYLTEYGGAERVLEAVHELYPSAPVYTSIYDKSTLLHSSIQLTQKEKTDWDIRVSLLQRFPFVRWLSKQYTFFYPLVFEHFDLREYDVIISDGTIWSKGVLTTPEQLHIHYCHTPARFLYHYPAESSRRDIWYYRPVVRVLDHYLRIWDFESAQRPDFIIANSKTVAGRIKKFWRREATVIYPPVGIVSENSENGSEQLRKLSESDGQKNQKIRNSDALTHRRTDAPSCSEFSGSPYYLVVSRLSAYKNVDLAIKACNQLNLQLVVVGTGREEERLKAIAGENIKFLGFVKDSELSKLYKDCKALISTVSDEDLGIVPIEAMGFGKPVIALKSGGVTETIVDGETGMFFDQPTVESLVGVLKNFNTAQYRSEDCREQAAKFSKERFQRQFKSFVKERWRARIARDA